MDAIFIIIFVVFFAGGFGLMICACFNQRRKRVRFSTPVVVTSQSFEPSHGHGTYPTVVQTNVQNSYQGGYQQPSVQPNAPVAMPMPPGHHHYSSSAPYSSTSAPYPSSASGPFTTNSSSAPYPATAPNFDPNTLQLNPPSYAQVINVAPGKQPAYNPTW